MCQLVLISDNNGVDARVCKRSRIRRPTVKKTLEPKGPQQGRVGMQSNKDDPYYIFKQVVLEKVMNCICFSLFEAMA